jgi:pimeloyl-ACP methyl ester carboxylesterase
MRGIILAILIVLSFSACSKHTLYELSIDYARYKSDLELKIVELSQAKVHYLDNQKKSNKTLVLLHGFGGDKDNWNYFSNSLKSEYRVIVPDLAGFGESALKGEVVLTIEKQTEILEDFLNAIGVQNIYIVGNSMGGAISLLYSYRNGDKVKALVLIDALGLLKKQEILEITEEDNPLLHICSEEKFMKMVNLSMQKPPYIPDIFVSVLAEKKCAKRYKEEKIFNEMISDCDLSDIVSKIEIPTLILWGKLDEIINISNAKIFNKEIKNSKLIIFEGLGHVPLIEDPDKTAKSVEDFIREL